MNRQWEMTQNEAKWPVVLFSFGFYASGCIQGAHNGSFLLIPDDAWLAVQ